MAKRPTPKPAQHGRPHDRAARANPGTAQALFAQAFAFHKAGQFDKAAVAYAEVLKTNPAHFGAQHSMGVLQLQTGNPARALDFLDAAVALQPASAEALNNRGIALNRLKRHEEAIASYRQAIAFTPDFADAHFNCGNTLKDQGRHAEAIAAYDKAIALRPDHAEAHLFRGVALHCLGRYAAAISSHNNAISLKQDLALAYAHRGASLDALKQKLEAIESYGKAIEFAPGFAEAHFNLAVILAELKRYPEAAAAYRNAIAVRPGYAKAHCNLGAVLNEMKRYPEAIASYERAIELAPDYVDAHYDLGIVFDDVKSHERAVRCYEKALALDPDYRFVPGMLLYAKMKTCDWQDFAAQRDALQQKLMADRPVTTPFPALVALDSLAALRKSTETFARQAYPERLAYPGTGIRPPGRKIRLGYYSADFHNHATSYLMADLFERHDKSRFELVAFSFGPESDDAMRRRVEAAFDQFHEVGSASDAAIAALSRQLEIDIAVDLKGYTTDGRPGIFAQRAAPLQVSYLGYPGTMGVDFIDYLVADATVLPPESRQHYTEKIVYLPFSYQVNDGKRVIADRNFTRAEVGLPETGFVFCCFNNNHKITPDTFAGWMRILGRVPGSVLWLFEDNPAAAANLCREAEYRGISAGRLVFARRMPLAEHLARHRLADLCIDTLPYNAHTTASDALWASLPVLTLMGESFAARVAASLLHAIELPELITRTQLEFEDLAVELAMRPEKLQALKAKLQAKRLTAPLFDTARFTRHLEDAYAKIYRRHQASLPPEDMVVGE